MVKNWFSSRYWHVFMQLISSHRDAHSSRSFPSRSATQNHPGAICCSEDVTLRSHLQFKILDFILEVPSNAHQTTEISACNYVAFPLARWRRVTLLHLRRIVMDSEDVSCMNLNSPPPIITVVTTSPNVEIVQKPCHPSLSTVQYK